MDWDSVVVGPSEPITKPFDQSLSLNGRGNNPSPREVGESDLERALLDISRPFVISLSSENTSHPRWKLQYLGKEEADSIPWGACFVPALGPESLGDRGFCQDHGLRYPYVTGAMANGIGSVEIVQAMNRAGMLGFFGSAGLSVVEVERAIDRLSDSLGPTPFGFNLIHSPNEPNLEADVVELYLRRGVSLVEASAYLDLTLPLVKYRVSGLSRDRFGKINAPNKIIAKVSRVEVARKFLSPPPEAMLRELVTCGDITTEQAELAREIPMAQDLTAEADSAGHTDNRPALALLPTMMALRNRVQKEFPYDVPLRVGAAGGISTPASAAAAFSMGAAYIVTGSVNQACVESGSCDVVREMLAQAEQADIMMAPAADMFEMGVKLQVLKRGTMFGMRASKLWEIYRTRNSLEDIPAQERRQLEKTLFRQPLEEVWKQTCDFFGRRDPEQITRAEADPHHKMALVFRWYLGLSSRWANSGDPDRKMDYQIWCGPAMGAFNEWVKGSFLEQAQNRRVETVALNLLYGAAVLLRSQTLRFQGLRFSPSVPQMTPLELPELQQRLNSRRPNE